MVKYCHTCDKDTSHRNGYCAECYLKETRHYSALDQQMEDDRIRAEKEYQTDLETIREAERFFWERANE